MVLLIVDTQELITTPDLYRFDTFEHNVKILIAQARANDVEVMLIRGDKDLSNFKDMYNLEEVKKEY